METLTLRFINEDATYEFVIDAYQHPLQINNAFIAFAQQYEIGSDRSFSSAQRVGADVC